MNVDEDIAALERHLQELAATPDEALSNSYAMHRPNRPPGLYWQLRWLAGRTLRWLESVGILSANPWPVSLAHTNRKRDAEPVLIWAVGTDRDVLREATRTFSALFEEMPGFAPVLVTDVADFAFFSRLGWLVEYLPAIDGDGEPFEARKARHLARLYRTKPALPINAGLAPEITVQTLRRWIKRAA